MTEGANTPVEVWFCSVAVVLLSLGETLLTLEAAVSGLVLLSGGRLGETGDDEEEEEEEEVGVVSLLKFGLMT